MSAEKNKETVRTLLEAVNSRTVEEHLSLVAENCESLEVPIDMTFRGREGWKEEFEMWIASFPDGRVEIRNLVAEGPYVAAEYTGRGTLQGPFPTPAGEFAPNGKEVEVSFLDLVELEDGQVVRSRSYWDLTTVMRQLGFMPEGAEAPGLAEDGGTPQEGGPAEAR